eukprot:gnl/TRDRNA2_/TRDRNA2_173673_c0_seq2.p2 gnl/TRDRNA2_/TRDRNA2_173673_c0~~gnl/TRDRNA2_/TRDRNA2_173673_c0_seq2.p2  ORF type:complete len:223 (+),score=61.25 gnl/TRDRNA2_/TRDRNA2_173673_c0_seq2:54-722(+)
MSLRGVIKNYDHNKGYGFITYEGEEVFLHVSNLAGAPPNKGDTVMFDIEPSPANPGTMVAKNVSGGTGAAWIKGKYVGGQTLAVQGTGKHVGVVKNFGKSGWGFIIHEGQEYFCMVKDCVGSRPQEGDVVQFDLAPAEAKPGTMKAVNVTGGTAPLEGMDGKGLDGKGKGKGYGKMDGKGGSQMEQMVGMMEKMMGMMAMMKGGKGGGGGKGKGGWESNSWY